MTELECQDCGYPVRTLTPAEEQQVADRPDDFVVYCPPCGRARQRDLGGVR
jgi:predicted  nucleic acid-binding Zn-ribbon protein